MPSSSSSFFASQTFASLTVSVEYAVFFAYSVAQCLTGTVLGFILFRNRIESKHLAGSAVGRNLGNVRVPLVFAVFGDVGLRRVVVFDFFNQISILVAAYVLFALSSRSSRSKNSGIDGEEKTQTKDVVLKAIKTQMFTPCLLALYFSIALKAIPNASIPYVLDQFLGSLAVAAKPLALLSLGILFEPKMSKSEIEGGGDLIVDSIRKWVSHCRDGYRVQHVPIYRREWIGSFDVSVDRPCAFDFYSIRQTIWVEFRAAIMGKREQRGVFCGYFVACWSGF